MKLQCGFGSSFSGGSEIKVGEYDGVTGTLDLTRGLPLLWRGKSPPKDRTLRIIDHSTVNITIYAVLASASSVGIVMAAIFLAINIKYRNQRFEHVASLNHLKKHIKLSGTSQRSARPSGQVCRANGADNFDILNKFVDH